jgi:flagellar biosynthesis/type III secretory pathway M-ring protein FliF/YscJ
MEQEVESTLMKRDALQRQLDDKALNALKLAPVITKTAEVMARHLRDKIKQEPEISAQVLRSWIREEES